MKVSAAVIAVACVVLATLIIGRVSGDAQPAPASFAPVELSTEPEEDEGGADGDDDEPAPPDDDVTHSSFERLTPDVQTASMKPAPPPRRSEDRDSNDSNGSNDSAASRDS